MSQDKETWYAVRRADGKYLVVVKTPLGARLAMWIDNIELATQWPFMTGATLEMGLDLDPALQAERGGWDVVPVQRREAPAKIVQFAIAIPALLICLLFSNVASAQTSAPVYSPWVNACLAQYPPIGEESQAAAIRSCLAAEPKARHFDWKPVVAVAAGQSFDAISTHRFLRNGSGCVEANRLIGTHPSSWTLAGEKAAVIVGSALLVKVSGKSVSRPIRIIGQTFAYALGAVGARSGVRNVALCGW